MATATSELLGIGGSLLYNILTIIAIAALAIGFYFGTKFLQKNTKKAKSFNINAAILDLNGVIDFDMLGLSRSEDTGLFEMTFKIRKGDSIPPIPRHLIKNGWTVLLNYAPGHYAVLDTSRMMDAINEGRKSFDVYNLGMKKYLITKQREIMNKSEKKKKNFELKAPWYTLGITVLFAVVLTFLLVFVGAKLYDNNIAARIADCRQLFIHP